MSQYIFELEMQGVDHKGNRKGSHNNPNPQHFPEHPRHEFLAASGIPFVEMRERGIDPVVNRIEINYKSPLRSRDRFVSKLYMRHEGIKFVFYQDIYKVSGELCIKAVVETVCTSNGRITRGDELLPYFEHFLQ